MEREKVLRKALAQKQFQFSENRKRQQEEKDAELARGGYYVPNRPAHPPGLTAAEIEAREEEEDRRCAYMFKKDPDNTNMADGKGTEYQTRFVTAAKKIDRAAYRKLNGKGPILLSFPAEHAIRRNFDVENDKDSNPFEPYEFRSLQYMTLLFDAEAQRGVLDQTTNWEESIAALSPGYTGSRSGTATPTPRSERDPNKPRVKISLADYKAGKRGGTPVPKAQGEVKANPTPATNDTNSKPVIDDTQKMIDAIVASNPIAPQTNGVGGRSNQVQHSSPLPKPVSTKPSPALKPQVPANDIKKDPEPKIKERAPELKSKRPLDDDAVTPPEKRSRIDLSDKLTHAHNALSSAISEPKATLHATKARTQESSKVETPKQILSKATEKATEKTEVKKPASKPAVNKETAEVLIPPMLSPLPATLLDSDSELSEPKEPTMKLKFDAPKKPAENTTKSKDAFDSRSPAPVSLPPLLSPKLPSWIEKELARDEDRALTSVKEAALPTAALHGVEARHERSRMPDAPGVARKTAKPKKSAARNTKFDRVTDFEDDEEEQTSRTPFPLSSMKHRVLKLKYGKRNAKRVRDILRLRPTPAKEQTVGRHQSPAILESAPRKSESAAASGNIKKKVRPADDLSSSESVRKNEDQKAARLTKGLSSSGAALTPNSQKRARPTEDLSTFGAEPTSGDQKRARVEKENTSHPSSTSAALFDTNSLHADSHKNREISHAHKPNGTLGPTSAGPNSSATSHGVFGTPKKGDAMKSVMMRKVDSSEGNPRTPMGNASTPAVSTPASHDKMKNSGSPLAPFRSGNEQTRTADIQKYSQLQEKYNAKALALKRLGEASLLTGKDHPKPHPQVSPYDHKLGTVYVVECIMAYMLSFEAIDNAEAAGKHAHNKGGQWATMLELLVWAEGYARRYPELLALLCVLGAICREHANTYYMGRMLQGIQTKDFYEQVAKNSKLKAGLYEKYVEANAHDRVRFVVVIHDAHMLTVKVIDRFVTDQGLKHFSRLSPTK